MGKMGFGYGSQFHLLRYLGYHRAKLNRAVEEKAGGRVLDWLDFSFDPKARFPNLDSERKGLDFLDPDLPVTAVWKQFWPQIGNVPNWDAVGLLQSESQVQYLLVEAKAHAAELKSDCSARADGGLPKILEAFDSAIKAYGFNADPAQWLKGTISTLTDSLTFTFLYNTVFPRGLSSFTSWGMIFLLESRQGASRFCVLKLNKNGAST